MWAAPKLMMMGLPDPFTFWSFVLRIRGFFLRPRTMFLRLLDFGLKSPNVVSFISLSILEDKFRPPQKSFPLPTKFAGLFAAAVMYALNAVVLALSISPRKCQGKAGNQYGGRIHLIQCSMAVPSTQSQLFLSRRLVSPEHRLPSAAVICSASLNARCGAEQTQTVTRQSSTITIAPIQGKEKSPELDDGGTGFPPRDDGDGGGGGGGGGGGWSGGFFFFGLLAFLGFLKDQESEGPYKNNRRS